MTQERVRGLSAMVTALGCAVILACLTGCARTSSPAAPTTMPTDDLAASRLDVRATVEQIEPLVTRVPVDITFLSNGIGVQLGPGDSVQCNGVQLRADPSDRMFPHMYRGDVPRVQVGGVSEFTYAHQGVRVAIRAPVVPGPTVISPPTGAELARTPKVTITYVAATSAGISGEINQAQGFGGEFATSSSQSVNIVDNASVTGVQVQWR